MDTRKVSTSGKIRLHYKGGIYREMMPLPCMFRGKLNPEHLRSPEFQVLHSDDARLLHVACHAVYGLVVLNDRDEGDYDVMVYVSLKYGTVWSRRLDEFRGTVRVGGAVVERFGRYDMPLEHLP